MSTPSPTPETEQTDTHAGRAMTAPILPGTGHSPMAGEGLTRVIAIMCFLASVALGAWMAVGQAANNWTLNLAQSLTLQLKPNAEMAADEQMATALEILKKAPGVVEATPVSDTRAASLLEPWLGDSTIIATLPLPKLVEIKLASSGSDVSALASQLTAAIPGAVLDDHSRWNNRLARFAGALRWLAFAVLALIVTASAMIVVFATRADMASNHEIIEVLHLIGAEDRFIAGQFQKHFQWIALWASLMGIGAAAIVFLAMGQISAFNVDPDTQGLLPTLAYRPELYSALFLIPVLTVVTAALTARQTVLRVLKEVM
ncbi:MAG: ABC transporter permease [Alphaproteobacteria bacterium]|nr:MAG: ABC transporter permease [Alphaproteobacteria bacterium]